MGAVEYQMGHLPRDTTARYVHLLNEDKVAVETATTSAFGDIVDQMLGPAAIPRQVTVG